MIEQKKYPNGRGFAVMAKNDPDRLKRLGRKGGHRAHELGVAHRWSSEEAQAAGRKGGKHRRRAGKEG